jgi:hypothetical protein
MKKHQRIRYFSGTVIFSALQKYFYSQITFDFYFWLFGKIGSIHSSGSSELLRSFERKVNEKIQKSDISDGY